MLELSGFGFAAAGCRVLLDVPDVAVAFVVLVARAEVEQPLLVEFQRVEDVDGPVVQRLLRSCRSAWGRTAPV